MDINAFDFDLPDALIAQHPSRERGGSRLMVVHRTSGAIEHSDFSNVGSYLRPGDVLVLNNTKVFPARLVGHRVPGGGAVECLLLASRGDGEWDALVHPGQKLRPGARMQFEREGYRLSASVVAEHFRGRRTIRLQTEDGSDTLAAIDHIGHIPLPPYIKRPDTIDDRERYQTVYARVRGSVAAPTAGLHITPALLEKLKGSGVEVAEITLHVGYGTFKPVTTEDLDAHTVDPESFEVSAAAADVLSGARREHRRIVAMGTTTTRALESLVIAADGGLTAASGETSLFLRPGHTFRVVDALVTNFHLPRSSLLALVAAFGGRELVLRAYEDAVRHGYRFYSYGDAMLIL